MKVCILYKGGGGGRTPNLNFLDFIFGRLLNLVTEPQPVKLMLSLDNIFAIALKILILI